MTGEEINAFIASLSNTLETMASISLEKGEPYLKPDKKTLGEVTGIIAMSGDNVNGHMSISFDKGSILDIASKMLAEQYIEINDEVVDVVGEITNMVCAGAKKNLEDLDYNFYMATPIVVKGKGVEISEVGDVQIYVIPISIESGNFVLEVSLAKK